MLWGSKDLYRYEVSKKFLINKLGISTLDSLDRPELIPYLTYIYEFINGRLMKLGKATIKRLVTEIFDIFDYGADKIIYDNAINLAFDLGISTEDCFVEDKEIPYNHDRFVFAWTNALSGLCVRLKLQYSYLFSDNNSCVCSCQSAQPDYDSWSSNVYAEDEAYGIKYNTEAKTNWRPTASEKECNCTAREHKS